jgi:N-acetylglutamate synthase-like GNAT family acetyltransferase
LHIRKARRNDAEALAQLMAQAGGEANGKLVAARIAVLARSNGSVVVADRGGVVGCAAWHLLVMLQGPPIGRLTLLVVERKSRRQGIGKALLESVAAEMKAKGCDSFEAVAEIDFSGTQNFFRRLGFDRKSYRFSRSV